MVISSPENYFYAVLSSFYRMISTFAQSTNRRVMLQNIFVVRQPILHQRHGSINALFWLAQS